MTGEQFQKLNAVMDKVSVGALKDGDDKSEKLRLFIDNIYDILVLGKNPQVKTNNDQVSNDWFCLKGAPKHPNPQQQKVKCDICHTQDFSRWKNCQEYKLKMRKENT